MYPKPMPIQIKPSMMTYNAQISSAIPSFSCLSSLPCYLRSPCFVSKCHNTVRESLSAYSLIDHGLGALPSPLEHTQLRMQGCRSRSSLKSSGGWNNTKKCACVRIMGWLIYFLFLRLSWCRRTLQGKRKSDSTRKEWKCLSNHSWRWREKHRLLCQPWTCRKTHLWWIGLVRLGIMLPD